MHFGAKYGRFLMTYTTAKISGYTEQIITDSLALQDLFLAQGQKVHLLHSKVYRMFPIIQLCLLLSLLVLIHASTCYSMHL